MAQENLISIAFTAAELTTLDNAFTAIEGVLNGKCVNLTADERHQYGKVADEMENWIGKAKDYMIAKPALVPSYINMTEVNKDFDAHKAILPRIKRVEAISNLLTDTNKLLGSDLYHNAMAYYNSLKVSAKNDAVGARTIFDDLKTQFPGRPKSITPANQ